LWADADIIIIVIGRQLKANGKKLLSQLQAAQSTVEKAKAKYEGSRKKQDAVQAEANADPNPKVSHPFTLSPHTRDARHDARHARHTTCL
jgi:hypothetical protein